jgi:glycosyltransferase involved in cell wall biosynthesis
LRILHLITTLGRGGAEAHLHDLIREQRRLGDEVACAFLKADTPVWAEPIAALGAEVVDLKLRAYGDPGPVFRLKDLAREFRAEVVHAHLQPAELYAALAFGRRGRPPVVISRHNQDPYVRMPGKGPLERWVVPHAAALIAISEAVAADLRWRNPRLDPARVRVVPYGVDLAPYAGDGTGARARLRAEWGLPPDARVIGTAARLVEGKRVDVILDAFARLAPAHPDLRLVVAGDGPAAPALKAQAQRLGLDDRVVFAGMRSDMPDVMRAFDLFAFASEAEGFGLVLLEAMAARLPIVASDRPPMSDLVADGVNGLTAAVGDPEAFAAGLRRLLDDPALAARMGEAGRAVAEAHGLARMAERTRAVYHSVLTR